jgi:hypothetical protein
MVMAEAVGLMMIRRTFIPEMMLSGDGAGIGILCSLSLGVVEVGRDGDDGVSDVVAQVGLSGLLHLKEDHQRIKNTIKVC